MGQQVIIVSCLVMQALAGKAKILKYKYKEICIKI